MSESVKQLAAWYLSFAELEARDRSPLYENLARRMAEDVRLLTVLGELPPPKQQPNLLFAAVKYLCGAPQNWSDFRTRVTNHWDEIVKVILSHSTQTNEPARCAMFLPVLAGLPQPLALIEVGASAGLCLLPDYYAYSYNGVSVPPSSAIDRTPPTLACRFDGAIPVPKTGIDIAWRGGLDLNPVDVFDEEQTAWLEALVWPDEGNRSDVLRAALQIAREKPPRVVKGDLRTGVPALVDETPKSAHRVVLNSAALCYITSSGEIEAFAEMMRALGVTWISSESPRVLPWITEKVSKPWRDRCHLLSVNEQPVAWADPHGTSIEWIG